MNYPFSDETQGSIRVSQEVLDTLKNAYDEAIDNQEETIYYNDMSLDINYATYLISYMENILNLPGKDKYA